MPTYLPTIYLLTHVLTTSYYHLATYLVHVFYFTYLLTVLPTYSPTYLLTYLPTYLSTHSPTYSPPYLPTYSPTYLAICSQPLGLEHPSCLDSDLAAMAELLNFLACIYLLVCLVLTNLSNGLANLVLRLPSVTIAYLLFTPSPFHVETHSFTYLLTYLPP